MSQADSRKRRCKGLAHWVTTLQVSKSFHEIRGLLIVNEGALSLTAANTK